jgi:predicted aminopeptidase
MAKLVLRAWVFILAVGALSACGIADHFQAENRMDSSLDAYRKCLAENVKDPPLCDPMKALYERDKAAFEK